MVPNFSGTEFRNRLARNDFVQEKTGACWAGNIQAFMASIGENFNQESLCKILEIGNYGPRRITGLFSFFKEKVGFGYHESNCTFSRLHGLTNYFPERQYGIFAAVWDDIKVDGLSKAANTPSVHIISIIEAGRLRGGKRFVQYYNPDSSGGLQELEWRSFDSIWHEGTRFRRGERKVPDLRSRGRAWLVVAGLSGKEIEDKIGVNRYGRGRNI